MSEAWQDTPPPGRRSWPFECCSRRGGLIMAAVLAVIGLFFSTQALNLPFGNLDLPGPGFLPFAFGLLLMALSVAIFLMTFQGPKDAPPVELGHAPVMIALAGLGATAFFFERLGAFISLGGFTMIMLIFVAKMKIVPAVLSSVIGMLVIWYVFKVLLGVQLPAGPLEGVL